MKLLQLFVLVIVCSLLCTSPSFATIMYNVTVNTSSINGVSGNLDFTFSGGWPAPLAGTVTISNYASDGSLGAKSIMGDASGSLITGLSINNTPGYNDYYVPFTYGDYLNFSFFFSGPAATSPDPSSGISAFAFSLLDSTGAVPLLVDFDPNINPGGFAVTAYLNSDGSTTVSNYMTSGTVNPVPEPGTLGLLAFGLAAMAAKRMRRRP